MSAENRAWSREHRARFWRERVTFSQKTAIKRQPQTRLREEVARNRRLAGRETEAKGPSWTEDSEQPATSRESEGANWRWLQRIPRPSCFGHKSCRCLGKNQSHAEAVAQGEKCGKKMA